MLRKQHNPTNGVPRVSSTTPAANWAGNVRFSARHWHHPSTVDELREAVRRSDRIHAVGTGHSFSAIADGSGDLVSLAGLRRRMELDTATRQVTIDAGVRYGELAPYLHERGYALANLASLPHLTVAGAVATGTHGSGNHNQSLAAAVTALELVTADGELVRLDREHPDFAGAVVALGALGVVSALTLRVEPTFEVAQQVYDNLPFERLTADFEEIFASAYSVSAFTEWRGGPVGQLWVKRRAGGGEPTPSFHGATAADGQRHPLPGAPTEPATEQLGVPGPWFARLPHFRLEFTPSRGDELQTEYLLPRGDAPAALRAIDGIRDRVASALQICELRTIAADDLWLSMAYQRDSVGIHFTWRHDTAAVAPVLDELERVLAPFAARPHWGKLFHLNPAQRYPRWADFRDLRARYDPTGKFSNAMLDGLFS
jgi:alditol oxidase